MSERTEADEQVSKDGRPVSDTHTISVSEETATIDTRDVVTGRVRVRTSTETVEHTETRELHGTEADVKRVPVDRMLEPGEPVPVVREEGDTLIVPIFEEVAVTEIRLVLKEELHLTQRATKETVEIPVALRKQTAIVEKTGPAENPGPIKGETE